MLELSKAYSPRFSQAFREIANGASSQATLEKVYGKPLSAIEADLRSYLRGDSFMGAVVKVKMQAGEKVATNPIEE